MKSIAVESEIHIHLIEKKPNFLGIWLVFNFLFKIQVFLRKNTSILVENSSATTFIRDSIECFSFFFKFKVQTIIPMPKKYETFLYTGASFRRGWVGNRWIVSHEVSANRFTFVRFSSFKFHTIPCKYEHGNRYVSIVTYVGMFIFLKLISLSSYGIITLKIPI